MSTLFFSVKQWDRFAWSIQEVICKKYGVILTDHQTRKEKTISMLNKINMKNFNKGMDTFNKSLNKFSKIVDSLTSNKSDLNQGKSMDDALGKVNFSKEGIWGKESVGIWGKPIGLSNNRVNIWPEKQSQSKDQKTDTEIW